LVTKKQPHLPQKDIYFGVSKKERAMHTPITQASPIMVTGAAGFIGAHTCRLLLEEGHSVIGIDNLNDAYDIRLKQWRLQQLDKDPCFTFHRLDIRDLGALSQIFQNYSDSAVQPGAVIHLAARAGVRPSVDNPWIYYETNLTGTLNLLEQCRRFKVPKLVLASTSSLYGSRNELPYTEDADTNAPLSPYAASKKAAETLCYSYRHLHGIDITVLRYFTVYGPAGRPDMSLFRFVQWISEERPVVIFGDGLQSRDFTHVDDIARGTIAAMRPLGYAVINLGSDHPHSLMEVLRMIEDRVGKRARIDYRRQHASDVNATWANVSKARYLLDWSPQHTLAEGIDDLVSWYQTNRSWASQVETGE
jgi:nucleoside-diphosphate-sugar epimerase